jgi:DNA-binding CsgD family transcriptional regulator
LPCQPRNTWLFDAAYLATVTLSVADFALSAISITRAGDFPLQKTNAAVSVITFAAGNLWQSLLMRRFLWEAIMLGKYGNGKRIPTPREYRVIELVAQGMKNGEVAQAVGTTEYVIKNYLRSIYDKLGLWNRVELALWYEARKFEASGRVLA